MYKKVFISYAKEDIEFASKLYDVLLGNSYVPWLDKCKLLPGSNWDLEIKRALKESDFIILLLSSRSVNKRGYVQREFKLALQYWETKLESDIYIIPVLIDNCDVPDGLSKFQWVRYDDHTAFDDILQALESQRTTYLKDSYVDHLLDAHYTKSLPLDLQIPFAVETSVKFPQFPQNPFFKADYVNAFIQHDIMDQMSHYSAFMSDEEIYSVLPDHLKDYLYFSSDYEIHYISRKHLSLTLYISSYWGGPHPNHRVVTKNFSFNPVKVLNLKDIVKFENIKEFVIDCYARFGNDQVNEGDGHLIALIRKEFEEWGATEMDFIFDAESLKLISNNILPHAFQGAANIDIPLKELNLLIKL